MDIYIDKKECEKYADNIIFKDKQKFKEYYNVLYSWDDIIRTCLATYTRPKKTSKSNGKSKHDPLGLYKKLIDDIKPNFYKQTRNAVENSLYYIFYKYRGGCYFRIRNNKLKLCCYLYNENYTNPNAKYMKIKNTHNNDKSKWVDLGGVIVPFVKEWQDYAIDFYVYEMRELIEQILKHHTIKDCDFIFSNKDRLCLKSDHTEASEEVVGSVNHAISSRFNFDEMIPILGFNWNERYVDFPMCTPDDIHRIFQIYTPPKCKNLYIGFDNLPDINWHDKIPTVIFRGSFTGNSINIRRNPRLHISFLSSQWKYSNNPEDHNLLNAGITNFNGIRRGRKEINDEYIRFLDKNYIHQLSVNPLIYEQQLEYKYHIYIEGNVAAYRGSALFNLGGVVLWVKSLKYHLWFEPYLEDKKNVIFIENDLSNLKETIIWLKEHDDDAKLIAANGKKFYNTMLTKESILDYCQFVLNSL